MTNEADANPQLVNLHFSAGMPVQQKPDLHKKPAVDIAQYERQFSGGRILKKFCVFFLICYLICGTAFSAPPQDHCYEQPFCSRDPVYAPCASACGTNCGVSICSIAAAVAAVVGVAAIIISTSGEYTHS